MTIRTFSQLIGKLVATQQGVEYAPLFYKPLEKVKEGELKKHGGNYNSFMTIPKKVHPVINWWIDNVDSSYKVISHGKPQLVLYSDSSKKGWGAYNETENIRTGGKWSATEQESHINILELQACQLTLHTFCKNVKNLHVRIYMDNTTSCSYINKLGGKTSELDSLAREIWFWCLDRHIHLSAAHVPGIDNHEAGEESRADNDDTEWSLREEVFKSIHVMHPEMSVDLFASRLNHKLIKYVARRPDPNAIAIDAFTMTWTNELFFIFPPFSLLPRILQKVEEDKAAAILIAPLWPTQSWWPSLLRLVMGQCYRLPNTQKILYLPHRQGKQHPLKRMNLGCFPISGKHSRTKESQDKQETLSSNHGEFPPRDSTILTLPSGLHSANIKLTLFDPRSMKC